jgi:hypothetical protein
MAGELPAIFYCGNGRDLYVYATCSGPGWRLVPPHHSRAAIPTDIKTAGYEAKFISPIDQGSFFRKITVFSVKNPAYRSDLSIQLYI